MDLFLKKQVVTLTQKYIESLCKKFDYKLSYFEKINLRKDDMEFLEGGLYLLDF